MRFCAFSEGQKKVMRIDKYLAENGFAPSRQKAKELVSGGFVLKNGRTVNKESTDVSEMDLIEITGKPYPYVGRGGLKLAAAQKEFGIAFDGKTACDVGASTGGFTDVMLRSGVGRVFAVDCGHGQLHPDIRSDPRVVNMESQNARELDSSLLGCLCDIVVSDLSFISQTLVFPAISSVLCDGGEFVSLIKPQFEAGKENIGKGGIVKDRRVHELVIEKVISEAEQSGLFCKGLIRSPITGGDGNTEYLAYFVCDKSGMTKRQIDKTLIKNVVGA